LKIAVLADDGMVQRFALDAIDAIEGTDEISVFSCTNTRFRRRWFAHGAYYLLNLYAIRNRLTRSVPLARGRKRLVARQDFRSTYEGAWQQLPTEIVQALNDGGFDVILKFGMGLLRVPPTDQLRAPILSFHHGDPDHYRGRPAGFWEITDGAATLGQVVQVISNRLDAGSVVAFAETRVIPWSYRATLIEAFRHSPLLINRAIGNAIEGKTLEKQSAGRNCRLPSNGQTLRFVLAMAARLARRLLYGAFVEKKWQVSTAKVDATKIAAIVTGEDFPPADRWSDLPIADRFTFYADPFFTVDPPGILVEALDARSGLGRIVHVQGTKEQTVAAARGHMSYPAVTTIDGRELILPEIARWSPPRLYRLRAGKLEAEGALQVEGNPRLIDATLLQHEDRLFLFANRKDVGSNALYLWWARNLDEPFAIHPDSPVRIAPSGARMGGALFQFGGRLIRFGQDFTGRYGDGLFVLEIDELTPDNYRERTIGKIAFQDRRGPHTINFRDGEILFDWYSERFSLLASVRRLAARRSDMEQSAPTG
jgi:hypothetical protein